MIKLFPAAFRRMTVYGLPPENWRNILTVQTGVKQQMPALAISANGAAA
jgi:hypothetical protein